MRIRWQRGRNKDIMKGAKLLQELRLLNFAFYRAIMRETGGVTSVSP